MATMDDLRSSPRTRVAVKAIVGSISVLFVSLWLLLPAAEERRTGSTATATTGTVGTQRRLGFFGNIFGEPSENEQHEQQQKTQRKQKLQHIRQAPGDPDKLTVARDAPTKGKKLRPSIRSAPPKVLDTVDLAAEDGLMWQPISMSKVECSMDERDCETTVRFCLIAIGEYQENPWKFPMSVMLQKKSQCHKTEQSRVYKLSTLRAYRDEHPHEFLQPDGFVYHETRTGSTLVANMLAHVPTNLVLSEYSLAEDPVRRCPQCSPEQRLRLLRDIISILGTAQAGHTHLFFKLQDSTTLSLMSEAFPDVSWVFLFRDPVEVMVSNLKGAYGKRNRFYEEGFDFDAALNVTANHEGADNQPEAQKMRPMMSPCLMSAGARKGAPKEEICANRLKVLCEAAVTGLEQVDSKEGQGRGAVVEYTNLPDVVTDYIYPDLFGMGNDLLAEHLPYLSEAARMYSKSMAAPESNFTLGADAGYKHVMAEKTYEAAAESTGLADVYRTLQGLQTYHHDA